MEGSSTYNFVRTCIVVYLTAVILIYFPSCRTLSNCSIKSYFEGEIRYNLSISNGDKLIKNEVIGNQINLYVKSNQYCSKTNGSPIVTEIYNGYGKLIDIVNDSIVFTKSSKFTSPYLISKTESVDTILGIICNMIEIEMDSMIFQYYYSAKFKMNQDHFKSNAIDLITYCIGETGCIGLRTTEIYSELKINIEAQEINEYTLSDSMFRIEDFLKSY